MNNPTVHRNELHAKVFKKKNSHIHIWLCKHSFLLDNGETLGQGMAKDSDFPRLLFPSSHL